VTFDVTNNGNEGHIPEKNIAQLRWLSEELAKK
jgi:hypothetical protein